MPRTLAASRSEEERARGELIQRSRATWWFVTGGDVARFLVAVAMTATSDGAAPTILVVDRDAPGVVAVDALGGSERGCHQ